MNTTLRPIGMVRSALKSRAECPRQGTEGAPAAWLEVKNRYADALDGLAVGDRVVLLTWLHQARRQVLRVHPRGNLRRRLAGVFATRSPDRPNPIGLHEVTIVEIDGTRLRLEPLEVVDRTPVVDIKPVLICKPAARAKFGKRKRAR
jgi:tRNA-Thr(GGU) m(6)t(6)A37 methyltransferase TsaA